MSQSHHDDCDLLLYFHHNSFYCQKVMMTLLEKGLNFKTHLVNLPSNQQYEPWFLNINPLGEVPVLVDGIKVIPDSQRIIQYVEDNFTNGYRRLLPVDGESKMDVINLRNDIDSMPIEMITKGAPYHPQFLLNPKSPFLPAHRANMTNAQTRRFQILQKAADQNPSVTDILLTKANLEEPFLLAIKNEDVYDRALEKVDELLNKIEAILIANNKGKPEDFGYLFPSQFTMADISLTILMVRLDQLGLSHRFWNPTDLRPLVWKYFSHVMQRDSVLQCIPHASDVEPASPLWYLVSGLGVLVLLSAVYFFRRRK